MGGDQAPEALVAGALRACSADGLGLPAERLLLVGDEKRITPLLGDVFGDSLCHPRLPGPGLKTGKKFLQRAFVAKKCREIGHRGKVTAVRLYPSTFVGLLLSRNARKVPAPYGGPASRYAQATVCFVKNCFVQFCFVQAFSSILQRIVPFPAIRFPGRLASPSGYA